ncbi:MAG: C-GCAxxG-C-C family protein [Planctomycetes bacterium]|nr:C-GCAxxG-C-C family protein [Planctomycetota bacterium]
MAPEKAVKYFHGKERYNCAQAVLKGFEESHNVQQEKIDEFKAFGGGRADGGLCGALFAAKALAKDSTDAEKIEAEFIELAGALKCKEIRKIAKLPCKECVFTAASLLKKIDGWGK